MSQSPLLCERQNGVLTLTFNRPGKKNALTKAMYSAMTEALQQAQTDPEIRVVVIRGQATAFTAGNDLDDFNAREPGEKSPAIVLLETLHRFEKPVVAAVAGVAVGIGATMLLHCDLVYAAPDTRFRMPFINLGVVPEGGSSLLIPMRLGHQRAARLLLLGEFFTTHEALEAGIVSEQVPLETLFKRAGETASRLSQLPQQALRTTKRLMKQELKSQVAVTIEREARLFAELLQSSESQQLRDLALERR